MKCLNEQSHAKSYRTEKGAKLMTLRIIARYLGVELGLDGFENFHSIPIFLELFLLAEDGR